MPARITLESALKDIVSELDAIEKDICVDRFAARNKVWRRAKWIYDNAIDVRVEVANNEQKGYTDKELSFNTIPMRTKAETGERQTADYVFYWKFKFEPEEEFKKMGICFERKEVQDFHGTVVSNYDRFDREMDRFLTDPKTKMMFVLVEGSLAEALVYHPPKYYPGEMIKNMIAVKLGAIASIEARGIHVSFRGSRLASANSIKGYVMHYFEKNIEFVLREELQEVRETGTCRKAKDAKFVLPVSDVGSDMKKPAAKKPATKRAPRAKKHSTGTKKKG